MDGTLTARTGVVRGRGARRAARGGAVGATAPRRVDGTIGGSICVCSDGTCSNRGQAGARSASRRKKTNKKWGALTLPTNPANKRMALLFAALRVLVPLLYVADQVHSLHVVHQLYLVRVEEERAAADRRRDAMLVALFRRVTDRCLASDDVPVRREQPADTSGDGLLELLALEEEAPVASPPPLLAQPPPPPPLTLHFIPLMVAPFVHVTLASARDTLASAKQAAAARAACWRRVSALRFSSTGGRSHRRRRVGVAVSVERVLFD